MNLFINENWEIILEELKPGVTNALSKVISSIVDSIFTKTSYGSLFLDGGN
jgi:hypothetical protein